NWATGQHLVVLGGREREEALVKVERPVVLAEVVFEPCLVFQDAKGVVLQTQGHRRSPYLPMQNRLKMRSSRLSVYTAPTIAPSSSRAPRSSRASNSGGSSCRTTAWAWRRCSRQASTCWRQRLRLGARTGRAWALARLARAVRSTSSPAPVTALVAGKPGNGRPASHLVATARTAGGPRRTLQLRSSSPTVCP